MKHFCEGCNKPIKEVGRIEGKSIADRRVLRLCKECKKNPKKEYYYNSL